MRSFKTDAQKLKIPGRSGFDKSHFNLLTSKVGTITPILVDEVIGNTKINLRVNLGASMPPLAADTYMKCDIKVESFFIPYRIMYQGFAAWFTQSKEWINMEDGPADYEVYLPFLQLTAAVPSAYKGPGTLLDYLGFKMPSGLPAGGFAINPWSLVAYHLCYQEYYRNSNVQLPCFAKRGTYGVTDASLIASLPYTTVSEIDSSLNVIQPFVMDEGELVDNSLLADGVSLFELRQRNFGFDYFTTALPSPQRGSASLVEWAPDETSVSIAAIRAANSLQIFRERLGAAGSQYVDAIKERFGCDLSNGVAQRPVLLGAASYNVYNKTMVVTAANANEAGNNPFSGVAGAAQGNAYASGSDLIIDGFTALEPGIILVNATLVPKVTYSSGIRRYLTKYTGVGTGTITDMPNPTLQNVGMQPIYGYEISSSFANAFDIFGYTDRYGDSMTMEDELHGLFRLGESLESFAAQRYLAGRQQISSNFLKIPTNYLDNVTVVDYELSNYGYWLECAFDYKVSMPLAEYSTPSLEDPAYEHGETITLHRGSFRF